MRPEALAANNWVQVPLGPACMFVGAMRIWCHFASEPLDARSPANLQACWSAKADTAQSCQQHFGVALRRMYFSRKLILATQ